MVKTESTGEREILFDAIHVGFVDGGRATKAATALGVFGLRQMALARAGAQNFSAGRNFKPLGHGLLCFNAFGTSHKSFSSIQKERAIYVARGRCASDYFGYLLLSTAVEKYFYTNCANFHELGMIRMEFVRFCAVREAFTPVLFLNWRGQSPHWAS
jgi:hypothetical protein